MMTMMVSTVDDFHQVLSSLLQQLMIDSTQSRPRVLTLTRKQRRLYLRSSYSTFNDCTSVLPFHTIVAPNTRTVFLYIQFF